MCIVMHIYSTGYYMYFYCICTVHANPLKIVSTISICSQMFIGSQRGAKSIKGLTSETREFERQADWAIVGWISETDAINRCSSQTKGMYLKRKYKDD